MHSYKQNEGGAVSKSIVRYKVSFFCSSIFPLQFLLENNFFSLINSFSNRELL